MPESSESILLQLPRPQYVPLPEAFISAIAWRIFGADVKVESAGPVQLRYSTQAGAKGSKNYRNTIPVDAELRRFGLALEASGITGEAPAEALGRAVANSVKGVKSRGGDSQAVSPLTPGLAMLQNVSGLQGAPRPPDLGEILEVLFALGKQDGTNESTVSDLWHSAVTHRMKIDPMLSAIDMSVDGRFLDGPRFEKRLPLGPRKVIEHGPTEGTPFEWFFSAWQNLTSEKWVDALPARVWVDWATTVLRLGYGLGYLWESNWYETIARRIVLPDVKEFDWASTRNSMPDLLPWRSSRKGPQTRDVSSLLSWRSYRADQIRHELEKWLAQPDQEKASFEDTLRKMRSDTALISKLTYCLRSKDRPRSGKNLWEASLYALQTRMVGGPYADYYGLLRRNGPRQLTPDPGTEWIAVVASLACGSPGGVTTVSRVLEDLSVMGIRPELPDLVSLLERAGMARGSADADQGVLVQAAF